MESQIFMDENNDSMNSFKNKNKSYSPFYNNNLKGSIMPLGNFGEIKEEDENSSSNNQSKKESVNNLKNSEIEFGGKYIEDDFEEEPKMEEKKINTENKKLKKSSILGMSLNNNLFEFNNQYDAEYVGDLINEIKTLYKKRDKTEDELNEKDEKLKQSMINNERLKKLIEEKNKEIEKLKKK